MKFEKAEYYTAHYKGLGIKITHHALESNEGRGIWCYYIIIPEQKVSPDTWKKLWLPAKKVKFSAVSPVRIFYDYNKSILRQVSWHCGITYYQKYGQVKGFRSVEVGCDYDHLYDHEQYWSLELIESDAKRTADEILEKFCLPEEQKAS